MLKSRTEISMSPFESSRRGLQNGSEFGIVCFFDILSTDCAWLLPVNQSEADVTILSHRAPVCPSLRRAARV